MMLSQLARDHLFTYHPPTKVTQPKYDAIRTAEGTCLVLAHQLWGGLPTNYDDVNTATRAFAVAIDENAPDSADKSAAIRCVRLARNGMNEYIATKGVRQIDASKLDTGLMLAQVVLAQLEQARWQACAAVALDALVP